MGRGAVGDAVVCGGAARHAGEREAEVGQGPGPRRCGVAGAAPPHRPPPARPRVLPARPPHLAVGPPRREVHSKAVWVSVLFARVPQQIPYHVRVVPRRRVVDGRGVRPAAA